MAESQPTLFDKAAVFEAMPDHPAIRAILSWNHEAITSAKLELGELSLTIEKDFIREICRVLRDAGYLAFQDVTAVDWFPAVPRFHVVYHLASYTFKHVIRLRVLIEEDDASVESVTSVWPGANYYEREAFDLFGIRFEGHPNLRRIMMPEEWKGH